MKPSSHLQATQVARHPSRPWTSLEWQSVKPQDYTGGAGSHPSEVEFT